MLQRAASNAYSWWWASHVRTKQSKWLEQNLQDMEEKVQSVLKLIEEDGDSFAKRAEMYYKKRPELINFVEESYRAYRALAERYDHISTELQNANHTIASVFPEQVQFTMDEDDEDGSPRIQKKFPGVPKPNIPKVPKLPNKDIKSLLTLKSKKFQPKKASKSATTANSVAKSGLSKPEAVEEIDNLQKEILALQTEKEFVKSSYESGLTRYWDIEKQITDMQDKVYSLQDEFSVGAVIEDDEARTLMATTALKSCQETLAQLHEKQRRSTEEARAEQQRIKDAQMKLELLKNEFFPNQIDEDGICDKVEPVNAGEKFKNPDQEVGTMTEERQDLELLREKIKGHFELGSNTSLTVTEMAEKIDELVNKVISLEAAVSSQTALIKRLRTETDDIQAQIRSLEDGKATFTDGSNNLSDKLREMEEKLHGIEDLNRNVEDQNNNLQTHFTEAHCNLDCLSEKLHSMKPDGELKFTDLLQREDGSPVEVKPKEELKDQESTLSPGSGLEKLHNVKPDEKLEVTGTLQKEDEPLVEVNSQNEYKEQIDAMNHINGVERAKDIQTEVGEDIKKHDLNTSAKIQGGEEIVGHLQEDNVPDNLAYKCQDPKLQEEIDIQESSGRVDKLVDTKPREQGIAEQEEEPNWRLLFLNGLKDREKILLAEYTTVLRNYKEVKKKLNEVEKKIPDNLFDRTLQLRELKNENAMKDEEIRSLRQRLRLLEMSLNENVDLKDLPVEKGEDVEEDDMKVILIDQPPVFSVIEEKFRMEIDELLETNLDFWLRFSTSIHQLQTFQTGVEDLQSEISKLQEKTKNKQEGSTTIGPSLKSDARPIYKHLREIQTQLTVWLEQSVLLKDELQSRFSSLCNIQEEISRALKEAAEDEEIKFTSYQAAKFLGELLNMKQENNKVADELQAGLDHVSRLQLEIEETLARLNEDLGISGSKSHNNFQLKHSISKSRVPLRSFIFGGKLKKQKPSILSSMNPALHRKYNHLRAGLPI